MLYKVIHEEKSRMSPYYRRGMCGIICGHGYDYKREQKDRHSRLLYSLVYEQDTGRILPGKEPVQSESGKPDVSQPGRC